MRALAALLVRLFPTEFRLQFEPDMLEQIRLDHTRALHRGRLAALGFGIGTALDLIRSAIAERRDPSWKSLRLPSPERQDTATMLSHWINDLRHVVHALRRAPVFTTITIVTLGLAIGANVGIFSVVDAVLLNPLPYADADRPTTRSPIRCA